MAAGKLPVVVIVRRGDLHHTGTELAVNVGIRHKGNLAVSQRKVEHLAFEVRVAFVFRVKGDGGVSQQRLWPRGGKFHKTAAVGEGIAEMVHLPRRVFMLNFVIGDSGPAFGAPVNKVLSLVDKVPLVKRNKDLAHRPGKPFVHGKALAIPVHACAGAGYLLGNYCMVFVF